MEDVDGIVADGQVVRGILVAVVQDHGDDSLGFGIDDHVVDGAELVPLGIPEVLLAQVLIGVHQFIIFCF
jgi:hypothetical protein